MGDLAVALGPEDAAEPLGFLLARAEGAGNLDRDVGVGQVDREVRDLRDDKQTDVAAAEGVEQSLALARGRFCR